MGTKVYAVIGSFRYDGHSTPIGIFTDWDKARDSLVRNYNKGIFDDVDIYEYELDVDSDGTLL